MGSNPPTNIMSKVGFKGHKLTGQRTKDDKTDSVTVITPRIRLPDGRRLYDESGQRHRVQCMGVAKQEGKSSTVNIATRSFYCSSHHYSCFQAVESYYV